jgi:hypothetical protein
MDELMVCTYRSCRRRRVPLDLLAGVEANKITFLPVNVGVDHFTATDGATNKSVRRVSFCRALLYVGDVQRLRRFFPNLKEIEIGVDVWSVCISSFT